jgi:hypothetical protein
MPSQSIKRQTPSIARENAVQGRVKVVKVKCPSVLMVLHRSSRQSVRWRRRQRITVVINTLEAGFKTRSRGSWGWKSWASRALRSPGLRVRMCCGGSSMLTSDTLCRSSTPSCSASSAISQARQNTLSRLREVRRKLQRLVRDALSGARDIGIARPALATKGEINRVPAARRVTYVLMQKHVRWSCSQSKPLSGGWGRSRLC